VGHRRPIKAVPALLLLLLAALLAGCGRPAADGARPLVVGMALDYPPFEMTDAAGNPTGVDVDLAKALGAALGRPVRIENLAFDGLIPSLQSGKIDLILSSMTATPERARAVAFSDPYLKTGLALLAWKDAPLSGPADLAKPGLRIAVRSGTTGQLYARDYLPQAKVLVFDTEDAAVLEVTQGKADAFIYDQMSVLAHALRHPDTTRPFLQPLREESWAIGLRQGDDALRAQVNAFLADFRAKGGFSALADRYLATQKAAFAKYGVPFVF